jgi:hypothetical protein
MELYKFSPILNKAELVKAIKYVAIHTSILCEKLIGKKLPIESLTIFSHYPKEYEQLVKIINKIGKPYNENNGLRVALNKPIKIGNNAIKYLRIRIPDPYRAQVGCNDFKVSDYESFKKDFFAEKSSNMRIIKREKYEMIEFFHPDFDVLAYVVSK